MRILITGITGFAGGHLAEALLAQPGVTVAGLSRQGQWPADLAHLADRAFLCSADLCDAAALAQVLRQTTPDVIYHLAGHADVGASFQQPERAWRDNLQATRTLYDSVLQWGGAPRILYVGSGLAYGQPRRADQVFDEDSPFYPVNPYAASKAAADLLSYQCSQFPGLAIVRARPFNHIGPRQSPQFAVAHFAKQIAAIELGLQEPVLATGNLEACRHVTDVRDVVQAYILLMRRGRPGEAYNIAAAEVHSMKALLERLLGLARVEADIRPQTRLARAAEVSTVRASSAKLRREVGWAPAHTMDQSLADTLHYWRQQLRRPVLQSVVP